MRKPIFYLLLDGKIAGCLFEEWVQVAEFYGNIGPILRKRARIMMTTEYTL